MVSICYINPSRNSLVPSLEISYKMEATPSLLSSFCGPFCQFLKPFDLYAIQYGWCIKLFCRQVILGSHHIHSSWGSSGTQLPALCFVDHASVCDVHLRMALILLKLQCYTVWMMHHIICVSRKC